MGSVLMVQSPCTGTVTSGFLLFSEIVSRALCDLPICNTSELHLGKLLTHSLQTRVSEDFCEVVSSQHFSNLLPERSGEVLQRFGKVLKFWMLLSHTAFYNICQ